MLVKLDGIAISDKDKERVSKDQIALTKEHIKEQVPGDLEGWEARVESLILNHKQICRVSPTLNEFTALRKLSLVDNLLSRIEGLENCKLIEELSLEKNKI